MTRVIHQRINELMVELVVGLFDVCGGAQGEHEAPRDPRDSAGNARPSIWEAAVNANCNGGDEAAVHRARDTRGAGTRTVTFAPTVKVLVAGVEMQVAVKGEEAVRRRNSKAKGARKLGIVTANITGGGALEKLL